MTQLWQSRLAKPKYNAEGDHTDDCNDNDDIDDERNDGDSNTGEDLHSHEAMQDEVTAEIDETPHDVTCEA